MVLLVYWFFVVDSATVLTAPDEVGVELVVVVVLVMVVEATLGSTVLGYSATGVGATDTVLVLMLG